jgi:exopolysaccharide biosynthesis polyprenyl glycosylphosphotransferase
MQLLRRKLLLSLLKISDLCILIIGILVASSVVASTPYKYPQLNHILSMRISISNLIALLAMMSIWHMACHGFQLYRSRRLESGYFEEWKDIIGATTTATVIFALGGIVLGARLFSPYFVSAFWFISTVATILFRTLLRCLLRRVRIRGRNLRLVIIVGTNDRAHAFARSVESNRQLGYYVLGYVDDLLYSPNGGKVQLLGALKDFAAIIRSRVVDEVIVALPIKSQYEKIQRIIEIAEEQGIVVRCLWNPFNTKVSSSDLAVFAGFPVVEMTNGMHRYSRPLAKRGMDMVLGSLLLLLTLPVMLVAAIAVKLTSRGPILFVQDRVGHNKRIFRLYKFRTMVTNADEIQGELESQNEMDGPVFKIRKDPRITKVGRWLRRLSIDELPQLFNVIRGDMSLVGPRPLPIRDYNGFDNDWQRRRFSVRPGLTCLWQVNGRNSISFQDWMKLDLEYIDNWSLLGDMKILFKTVPAIINGEGAS